MKVAAKDNYNWINYKSYDSLNNEDFWKIITFYIFHTPCKGLSAQGKLLKDYGWNKPWKKPYKLNFQLKQASTNFKLLFSAKTRSNMSEALEKSNMLDDFPSNVLTERICIHDNKKNQFISVFYHVRNAFAHGRFSIINKNGEEIFILEDQYQQIITARMILRKKTLLNWINIIESGEKEYTP